MNKTSDGLAKSFARSHIYELYGIVNTFIYVVSIKRDKNFLYSHAHFTYTTTIYIYMGNDSIFNEIT